MREDQGNDPNRPSKFPRTEAGFVTTHGKNLEQSRKAGERAVEDRQVDELIREGKQVVREDKIREEAKALHEEDLAAARQIIDEFTTNKDLAKKAYSIDLQSAKDTLDDLPYQGDPADQTFAELSGKKIERPGYKPDAADQTMKELTEETIIRLPQADLEEDTEEGEKTEKVA